MWRVHVAWMCSVNVKHEHAAFICDVDMWHIYVTSKLMCSLDVWRGFVALKCGAIYFGKRGVYHPRLMHGEDL